jgi:hypothetical protein
MDAENPLLHPDTHPGGETMVNKATRCQAVAGHDRQNWYLGQNLAAEDHIVRTREACIGCRSVHSHGSVKRSTLNHRVACRAL